MPGFGYARSHNCVKSYMFCAIWESMQSHDCVMQFWNPENTYESQNCAMKPHNLEIAQGVYVIWRLLACIDVHILASRVRPEISCIARAVECLRLSEDGYS